MRDPHLLVTELLIELMQLAIVLVDGLLSAHHVLQPTSVLVTHGVHFALSPRHLVLVLVVLVMFVRVSVRCRVRCRSSVQCANETRGPHLMLRLSQFRLALAQSRLGAEDALFTLVVAIGGGGSGGSGGGVSGNRGFGGGSGGGG